MTSQARGRKTPSNTYAVDDYVWDYGQIESSATPRNPPPLDLSQASLNQYPDQNEYTTEQPILSTSLNDITLGMASLGASSSSVQQPMVNNASWSTPSAPSNYIKTKDLSTDSEQFDPRECLLPSRSTHFSGQYPDIRQTTKSTEPGSLNGEEYITHRIH